MSKNKPKRKQKKSTSASKVKLINIFLLIFLFAFIATALSYFIMNNENSNKNIKNNTILEIKKHKIEKPKTAIENFQDNKLKEYFKIDVPSHDKFEEYTDELKKDFIDKPHDNKQSIETKSKEKPVIEKEKKPIEKKIHKKETKKKLEKSKKDTYIYKKGSKPKLAIIIDDVSSSKQKRDILNIGYKVTMAFLPPQKSHSNSAKIAQDLPVHMIHFPMQASKKFKSKEKTTLTVNDSYMKIEGIVKRLRKLYPKVTYTNNHTGSVFTQNDAAMDKLFKALKKYNFIFVDSRTTAKSVAKKYAKKYGMPYIVRNTFIDNKKNYNYIQTQLKKAIKIAKKRGYAIAIGHPHSLTIKVLRESKHLLEGVEPIFINQLPYL
jgi:polysaccharide deacetylase 2 family uncharacterized protein YibQ